MAGFDVMEMLNGNSIKEAGVQEWYQKTNYEDAKEIIRDELGNIRNSFIKVGYFLRRITEMQGYKEDGYETIWDCAKEQFGITRTTASRWMEINRRFSAGGYSPYLAEEYKAYNKSQLQEMLYLPEEKLEEVNPEMNTLEIREKGKDEPGEEEIWTYHEIVYRGVPLTAEYMREEIGKSYGSGYQHDLWYESTPRGVKLGKHDEMTWKWMEKKFREFFPEEYEERKEAEECAESHGEESGEEQIPGLINIQEDLGEMEHSDDPAADEKSREIQRMVEEEADRQQGEQDTDQGQENRKEKASIREQKTEHIMDTMTEDEDQENARKLHVLKMLEKYYIYLNEEEIEILRGMVQDCKRRKQEYALEDCGVTV